MAVTIDEVTADVAPAETSTRAEPRGERQPPRPSELRRHREQIERLQQRADRVKAD
jgi:hypothetical protein